MSTSPAATLTPCPDPTTLEKLLRDDLPADEAGRVEEHIGACPGCQRVLERLVGSLPATLVPSAGPGGPAADEEPPRLPGYAPLGRIDAGGMGVVWRARDLQFRRTLAVKVMKSWASADPAMVRRFVGEARVCGQLAHPFIVPVHAMGCLEDGRPYYAMKLVEGRTFAALLEAGPAPAGPRAEAVQIFGQVCQAVAFAHTRGVIHRDLKPENVLVGAHAEVQLTDWGLAKVLDGAPSGAEDEPAPPAAGPGGEGGQQTRAGSVMGTLSYMPPEQARGLVAEVDRRSDVFALGAILCQVLTGQPPYTGPNTEVIHRRAAEADLAGARDRLRGCGADPELVRLAERCLSAEKAGRPADAGEVAAAVAAYLSGVQQRLQEERLRREREEVRRAEEGRRRRLWLRLAAAVLLVLVAGVVGTTLGMVRADRARDAEEGQRRIAEAQKKQADEFRDRALEALRATTGEDVEKLMGAKPALGADERQYLEAIAQRWQAFAAQEGDDEQSRALHGEGLFRVADLREKLGRRDEARGEYEQARDVFQRLAEESPGVRDYRHNLGSIHDHLGILLTDLGRRDEARLEWERARDIFQALADQFPDVPEYRRNLANVHTNRGYLLFQLGKWEEVRVEWERARDIQQKLIARDPAPPPAQLVKVRTELARTQSGLGALLHQVGKQDEARVELEEARDLQQKLAAESPAPPRLQLDLARTHLNLGVVLSDLGKLDEARGEYEQVRNVCLKLTAQFPAVPGYQQQLASAHNNLGALLYRLNKWGEARLEYEHSRDIQQKLAAQFPGVLGYQIELGRSYLNLGMVIMDDGQPADSLPWLDKAIETLTAVHDKEPRDAAAKQELRDSYWNRARALSLLGRDEESMKDWQKAAHLGPRPETPEFRASRATALARAGRVLEAVAVADELARASDSSADQWYSFACVYAVAGARATDQKQQYAGRAMELLRKAVQAGFNSGAYMARDPDLDSLRERQDFKQLLAELGPKATTDRR